MFELNNIHVAFSYLKWNIEVMRSLGRSNLVGCQAAPADCTVILTCGVYTFSVDFGLSLGWLIAPADHTVILTCRVLLIQR